MGGVLIGEVLCHERRALRSQTSVCMCLKQIIKVIYMNTTTRVVKKKLFSTLNLACKLIPFYDIMRATKTNPRSLNIFFKGPSRTAKYTKEILKNTWKNQETGNFSFHP